MNQYFNGQSMLQIKLDTGLVLTDATEKKILWQDPNGASGEWVVTVTEGTKLVYNVGETDIAVPGNWKLQAYVMIGGNKGYGQVVIQNFKSILNS